MTTYDNEDVQSNPYMSSKKAQMTGAWYDSFARSGQLQWLVFLGPKLLARVENEAQAKNVVEAISRVT
jgi:hypothetical protein